MMSNKRLWLVPLLVLSSFFVHYISDFFYFIMPADVVFKGLIYLCITAIPFFMGLWYFRNKQRFTLVFSSLLFIFLFYGSLADTAVSLGLAESAGVVDMALIAWFCFSCMIVIAACLLLKMAWLKPFLKFWVIYCTAMMAYDVVMFLVTENAEKKYLSLTTPRALITSPRKPDVYFLLLDMYPSDTVLRKYLGYDNSSLAAFLAGKNFFVSGNARSLYQETYYAMPSTFSLQPLQYINDKSVPEYKKKLIALKNINRAVLPAIFEKSGYRINNYSVFTLQGSTSPLQFNLNYHLENLLTSATFFNRWYNNFEPDFFRANRNIDAGFIKTAWSSQLKEDLKFLDTVLYSTLNSKTTATAPSFYYFHFMMPHPPILYDSSGKENAVRDMYAYNGMEQTTKKYVAYIKYSNDRLKEYVKMILDRTGGNAVIILQGDHGYREFSDRFPDEVRHGILNAVYLPNKNYNGMNDTMTPIHSLKMILENQFNYRY
jgi:hypothetical protein